MKKKFTDEELIIISKKHVQLKINWINVMELRVKKRLHMREQHYYGLY
nr:MAG: hypothetical protein [Microvirus sp.]